MQKIKLYMYVWATFEFDMYGQHWKIIRNTENCMYAYMKACMGAEEKQLFLMRMYSSMLSACSIHPFTFEQATTFLKLHKFAQKIPAYAFLIVNLLCTN